MQKAFSVGCWLVVASAGYACSKADSSGSSTPRVGDSDAGGESGEAGSVDASTATWRATQVPFVPEKGALGDNFGWSIALSRDNRILAVGAPDQVTSNEGYAGGGVHLYRLDGGKRERMPFAPKAPTVYANYGNDVALSADGHVLVVGSPFANPASDPDGGAGTDASTGTGGVYVYRYSDTESSWSLDAEITPPGAEPGDHVGCRVAISADGSVVAFGAFGDDAKGAADPANNEIEDSGAVYVFKQANGKWGRTAFLKSPSAVQAGARFGRQLGLSDDGLVLATTAQFENYNGAAKSGAAYVFRETAGAWNEEAHVSSPNPSENDALAAIAISGDGSTVALGIPADDGAEAGTSANPSKKGSEDSGAAIVLRFDGKAWKQEAYVKASNAGAGDLFGRRVSLSFDGNTLAVGATMEDGSSRTLNGTDDNGATNSGAAYLFSRASGIWTQTDYVKSATAKTMPQAEAFSDDGQLFGEAVFLSSDGTKLFCGATQDNGVADDTKAPRSGAVFLFEKK